LDARGSRGVAVVVGSGVTIGARFCGVTRWLFGDDAASVRRTGAAEFPLIPTISAKKSGFSCFFQHDAGCSVWSMHGAGGLVWVVAPWRDNRGF
jgi:hypothetical protein